MKPRSLYFWTAFVGAITFTVPWLTRLAAQNSPIGMYSMSEWAHNQLNVNRTLETGQVGKVIGYVGNGVVGVIQGGGGGITEAPENGLWYARRDGEWQNFLPGGGAGTNVGGTNRLKLAALAEFRPPNTNGTLLPANTATFIRVNHIFDPDGIFTGVDTNAGSFRLAAGYYAITMVVPISVVEQGGGNVRIPFSIGLFDLTTTNDVYYQSYTVYDEDLSQYSQVFMPALITDGTHDFTIRVFNHSTTLDLVAGQAGNVAGLENHYTEIQFLKIDGIAGLPEAPINSLLYARSNQDWVSFTSPWAVQQLTKNTALESGAAGQAIGYTGPGVVGLVTIPFGAGDADTNAVASVPDIATLTNSVGYSKAIVGPADVTPKQLYQRLPIDAPLSPESDWSFVTYGTGAYVDNGDGSYTVTRDSGSVVAINVVSDATAGESYFVSADIKAHVAGLALSFQGPDANYPACKVYTSMMSTTDYSYHASTVVASGSNAVIVGGIPQVPGAWFTFKNLRVLKIPPDYYLDATQPNHWQQVGDIYPDALADGQTYGRKDGSWIPITGAGGGGFMAATTNYVSITDLNFAFTPSADVILVTNITTAPGRLTSRPSIYDGTPGQRIRLWNAVPPDQVALNKSFMFEDDDVEPIGSHVKVGAYLTPTYPNSWCELIFTNSVWQIFAEYPFSTSGLEVNALPAPWEPPDGDGVQVIRDDVQDALIDALLPRLLQRLALPQPASPVRGTGRRGGAPGTRDNPIDWPDASPAADTSGKYNINIRIGDR